MPKAASIQQDIRLFTAGVTEAAAQFKSLGSSVQNALKGIGAAGKQIAPAISTLERLRVSMKNVGDAAVKTGRQMQQIGRSFSLFVTAPIVGVAAAGIKFAADFEKEINAFVANTGVAGDALAAAKQKAIDLGNASIFSATEAARAMTELAKVGVDFKDIMGGAAEAVVNLAAANGAQLAPSAAIVGDVMKQFGLTTAELPAVINQISGALIQSKLDFDDYRLAIGQAGGAASALGVSFKDFNASLAATASSFASGSDAGTSFKVFLNFLIPKSKSAAAEMKRLGLSFFDAQGKMKSIAEIAQVLNDKLGNLSQKDLNRAVHSIFGTDAMRTAITLMRQGREGVEKMAAAIEKTDAAALAATRVKGFAGAMDQLRSAFETLAIAIGESGVLKALTDFVLAVTGIVKQMALSSPGLLKWGAIVAGLVAVIGPVLISLGLMTAGFGLLVQAVGKLGPAFGLLKRAMSFLAISNPIVTAIVLISTKLIELGLQQTKAASAAAGHQAALTELALAQEAVRAGVPGAVAGLEALVKAHREVQRAAIAEAETEVAMASARAQRGPGDPAALTGLGKAAAALAGLKKDLAQYDAQAVIGAKVTTAFGAAATGSLKAVAAAEAEVATATAKTGVALQMGFGAVRRVSDIAVGALTLSVDNVRHVSDSALGAVRSLGAAAGPAAAQLAAVGVAAAKIGEAAPDIAQLGTAADDAFATIREKAGDAIAAIATSFADMINLVESMFGDLEGAISNIFGAIADMVANVGSQLQAAISQIISSLQAAVAQAQALAQAAREAAAAAAAASASGHASGGFIRGPGTSTSDSILARLSDGEFVLSARAVRHWGLGFIARMNALRNPFSGFSVGGLVDGFNQSMAGLALPRFRDGGFALAPAVSGSTRTVRLEFQLGNDIFVAQTDEQTVAGLTRAAAKERMLSIGSPARRIAR